MEDHKFCPKCQEEKPLSTFHKSSRSKDGKQNACIPCRRVLNNENKKVRMTDPEYKEKTNTYRRSLYRKWMIEETEEEKAERLDKQKSYRDANRPIIQSRIKEWRAANKNELKLYWNTYNKQRRERDEDFRVLRNLRSRLHNSLRASGGFKSKKTLELLGCDIPFLKAHLESQWLAEMSWENYGKEGWHIDHIKPCSLFDLTQEEEQKKCFHYTNLQPLWATTQIAQSHGSDSIGNINKYNYFLLS